MQIAQELFEFGIITYHRTDSIRVSDVGMSIAKEFILENLKNENFVHLRTWAEGEHMNV